MPDLPTELDLAVGEERSLELPSLGTSGYLWDCDVVGDGDVVDVQCSRGAPPMSPARPAGISAPEIVTIRGRTPGTVELRLVQHRRWEPATLARSQLGLVVHVRAR
jgi:predicted secreted protein